jgi:outer membrane protein assembly factor BamE (lipoprotein component of BamABCDE complex)
MLKLKSYVAVLGLFIVLTACSTPPDKLGNLDVKKWRQDRGGCKGERAALVSDLKTEQKQLLGKFADDIGKILGRPDIHQLGERNTKFYIYFLEKGPQCADITKKSEAKKVILKFNAIGLMSEITYQSRPL